MTRWSPFFVGFLGVFSVVLLVALTTSVWQYPQERASSRTRSGRDNLLALFSRETLVDSGDLNHNGRAEHYELRDSVLRVTEGGTVLWESPAGWFVDGFQLADANTDGRSDLNLSVWKSGNFGNAQPFWMTENDPSVKNHFFVLKVTDNGVRPLWQSSNLERPNCAFRFSDVNGDRREELVVTEGAYAQDRSCHPTDVAVWSWNGWGFSHEGRWPIAGDQRAVPDAPDAPLL